MKEIVKVLLAEGIDEETIHEVLDIICEISDKRKNEALSKIDAIDYKAHKDAVDYSHNKGKMSGPTGKREEDLWKFYGKTNARKEKLLKAIDKHNKAKKEGKIKPANGEKYID